ncbi:MAG: hypothetical protein IRZ16_00895 [Myxococcaceae bacterium]|nr:hypothetical protein [Myxococcaceae bacterium]
MRRAQCLGLFGLLLAWSGCQCGGKIRSVEEGVADPVRASANVAGAVQATSPNFRLITTTTPAGGTPKSGSFSVRSGIVAGTQSTTESSAGGTP